jgi:hypothetical protein
MQLVGLWADVQDPDPWVNRESRQAYRDALASMQAARLIEDFDLKSVTFRGGRRMTLEEWRTSRASACRQAAGTRPGA